MALNASESLRLFIDSANTEVWKRFLPTGVFYGVTTNPFLLRESNVACQIKSLSVLSKQALDLGAKEVHLQAWGKNMDALVRTGSELASIDRSIVVQIPATYTGLKSAKKLKDTGARIGLIIYSMHQALLALGIGAEYMALNVGKVREEESKQSLSSIQSLLGGANHTSRLLVANAATLEELTCLSLGWRGKGGCCCCLTVTPAMIEQMFTDKVSEEMANAFEAAVSGGSKFSLFL